MQADAVNSFDPEKAAGDFEKDEVLQKPLPGVKKAVDKVDEEAGESQQPLPLSKARLVSLVLTVTGAAFLNVGTSSA
jgi:hypothetical protein